MELLDYFNDSSKGIDHAGIIIFEELEEAL